MSGGMRQYVGMAVAGTLLLAAGFGLYWVLDMGRGRHRIDAPVLTADATPVKVAPTPERTPYRRSRRVAGARPDRRHESTEPRPNACLALTRPRRRTRCALSATRQSTTAGEDRDTEGGLANRKVRTVTVRPDGTIVSGDDAVAGAEELPVDRPNVPDVPGATTRPSICWATAAVPSSDPIAAAIDTATATPADRCTDSHDADTLVGRFRLTIGGFLDDTKVADPTPAHQPDYAALAVSLLAVDNRDAAGRDHRQTVGPTDLLAATPAAGRGGVRRACPARSAYVQLTSSPARPMPSPIAHARRPLWQSVRRQQADRPARRPRPEGHLVPRPPAGLLARGSHADLRQHQGQRRRLLRDRRLSRLSAALFCAMGPSAAEISAFAGGDFV